MANYHGNGTPFSRAIAFNRLVLEAMRSFAEPSLQQAAIAELGEYKSRGHGGRYYPKSAIGTARTQHRRAWRNTVGSKGPHQGAREIARRAARGPNGQCGVLHG